MRKSSQDLVPDRILNKFSLRFGLGLLLSIFADDLQLKDLLLAQLGAQGSGCVQPVDARLSQTPMKQLMIATPYIVILFRQPSSR